MRFEGIASTTAVDREGERMTTAALEGMARTGEVELREGHRGQRVGVVEECRREGERLQVAGRLEEGNPRARALWEKLRVGVRLALSVGGRKRVVTRYSPVAGRRVRMIEEARLEHVAVCGPAEAKNGETEVRVDSRQSTVDRGEEDSRESAVDGGGGAAGGGVRVPEELRPPPEPPLPEGARVASSSEPPRPERSEGEGAGGEAPRAEAGRRRSMLGRGPRKASAVGGGDTNNSDFWKGVL